MSSSAARALEIPVRTAGLVISKLCLQQDRESANQVVYQRNGISEGFREYSRD